MKFLTDSCHGIDSTHHTGFTECLLYDVVPSDIRNELNDYIPIYTRIMPANVEDAYILNHLKLSNVGMKVMEGLVQE